MDPVKKLGEHYGNAHNFYFVDFSRQAYEIIYVEGNEISLCKVEELRALHRYYMCQVFPTKVELMKYSKGGKVIAPNEHFPKGTQHRLALVWKENNKILTDPSEFVTWAKEV